MAEREGQGEAGGGPLPETSAVLRPAGFQGGGEGRGGPGGDEEAEGGAGKGFSARAKHSSQSWTRVHRFCLIRLGPFAF